MVAQQQHALESSIATYVSNNTLKVNMFFYYYVLFSVALGNILLSS